MNKKFLVSTSILHDDGDTHPIIPARVNFLSESARVQECLSVERLEKFRHWYLKKRAEDENLQRLPH